MHSYLRLIYLLSLSAKYNLDKTKSCIGITAFCIVILSSIKPKCDIRIIICIQCATKYPIKMELIIKAKNVNPSKLSCQITRLFNTDGYLTYFNKSLL